MRCGSCGWDNPAGITFCTNCGKRLADRAPQPQDGPAPTPPAGGPGAGPGVVVAGTCPACQTPNPPGMRFCRDCGAPLGQDLPVAPLNAQPAAPVPAPSSGGETCWRCRAEVDPDAAFCKFCGAASGSAPDRPAASAAGAPGPELPPDAHPAASGMRDAGRQRLTTPETALGPARLVTLLKDGTEGRTIPLGESEVDIGSSEGGVCFPDDPYLSPRHARIRRRSDGYLLRDLDSVNGIYVRLREPVDLQDGDMVLIGQQVLRFEVLADGELPLGPAWQQGVLVFGTPEVARFARLVQYTTEGVGRDVHYLFRDETVLGRENGDIVFTDDPFLSRRHAAVRVDGPGQRFTLHDLGSSNGTAIRIRGERVLRDGDQFRMGRHLFRFELSPGDTGGFAGR